MMPIEFRAKRVDNNLWVYGGIAYTAHLNMGYHIMQDFTTGSQVVTETVGQYTGINDRGGAKIFGGDVIYLAGFGNYIVEFPFTELYDAAMENDIGLILGNIHDNPELINANK